MGYKFDDYAVPVDLVIKGSNRGTYQLNCWYEDGKENFVREEDSFFSYEKNGNEEDYYKVLKSKVNKVADKSDLEWLEMKV
jgi:hypothetical protein